MLILICFLRGAIFAQPATKLAIVPKKLTILTSNLDSLVRSYTKKGFSATIGERNPTGILSDHIYLESGFEIELAAASPANPNGWQTDFVAQYGARVSALNFETDDPDSLYTVLTSNSISCTAIYRSPDSAHRVVAFALDSCYPLDIIFEQIHRSARTDSLTIHKNHVYRLDWILLSCGERMKQIMTTILDITGANKAHQGCCDYWHMGSGNDYTLTRFEPIPSDAGDDPYWFSVEVNNFYWAY